MRCVGLTVLLLLSSVSGQAYAADAPDAGSPLEGKIRTQLMAKQSVTLSSELSATISKLPVEEGGSFQRGQVLVEFQCDGYRAQLRKAEATLEAAQQLLKVNTRLAQLNSIGELEVSQAEGKSKEAEADLKIMQTVVNKCVIEAPFSGRVAKRTASTYQYLSPGNPIVDLLDTSQLELRMIVPSNWLAWIKPGETFSVQVGELNRSYSAHVTRTGAQIDPVSQSVLVFGIIESHDDALLPGMSGWASFKPR